MQTTGYLVTRGSLTSGRGVVNSFSDFLLVEVKVNLLLYTGVRKPLLCGHSAVFLRVVLGMQFRSAQSEFGSEIGFRMKLEVRGIEWRRRGDDPIAEA
jgi:hypothetical protein